MKQPLPFGKYYLLERINVGGMAEVFKAKAFGVEGFERLLAIKRILPNIAEDADFIEMFIDEAKIAVQLTHANIAQIFDLGKVEEAYFIALEYVHGKDLRAIFDRARKLAEPIPISMAAFIIMKVCEGLDYAHNKRDAQGREMNLVHRDISPQNMLVSYEGEVKLIDFGIAKAANKASKTQAGILKGKFGYMSPEQVRGLTLDRKSDIFSLGIVLYELLTGERLFLGESDFSTLEKVRNVEIMPPTTYNHRISDELEAIVLRALEREPDERYHTAIDLHDDLQRFMYATGQFFSRKDLAAYMKAAFTEELASENAKLEEFKRLDFPMPAAMAQPPVGLNAIPVSPRTTIPPPAPTASEAQVFAPLGLDGSGEAVEVSDLEIVESEDSGIVLDSDAIVYEPVTGEVDITMDSPVDVAPWSQPAAASVSFPARPPMLGSSGTMIPPPERPPGDELPTMVQSAPIETLIPQPMTPRPQGVPLPAEVPFFAEQYSMPSQSTGSGKLMFLIALAIVLLLGGIGVGGYLFVLQSDRLGTLAIRSDPEEVEVLIGNQVVDYPEGSKPTFELEEGTYEITLLAEGYAPFKKVVRVRPGRTETLRAELEAVGASGSITGVKARTEPSKASIVIDGEPFEDSTPTIIPGLEPGEHIIEFTVPGYRPAKKEFTLKEGELLPLSVELIPLTVSLEIGSTPKGAVTITGGKWTDQEFGETPTTVNAVGVNVEYTISVSATGYARWSATRSFTGEKATVPIFATLEKLRPGVRPPIKPRTARVGTARPRTARPKTARPKTGRPVVAGAKGILKVNTKPWTKVFVDGREIGRTPILRYEISAGPHKVTLVCIDESVCGHIEGRKKIVNIKVPAGGSFFVKETLR